MQVVDWFVQFSDQVVACPLCATTDAVVDDVPQFIDGCGRPCDHTATLSCEQWRCLSFSSSQELVDIFVRNRDGQFQRMVAVKGLSAVFPLFSRSSRLSRS